MCSIAPYEPDWGTRQNMLEGRAALRRALFVILCELFFDVPPKKCGDLRAGKRREGRKALALVTL